jgi:phosphoribosylpyrophosphate synthetase/non-canonical (house-cleaning) NTP pyrophosphatase
MTHSRTFLDGPGSTLGLRMSKYGSCGGFVRSRYDTFPDGSDNIELGGFEPCNLIAGYDVVFCMNMESHKTILQCLSVLVVLTESFPKSLAVVVPFMPCATMERVDREGVVATANTFAKMMSGLPNTVPIRVLHYDLHTLQNRFYYSAPVIAELKSFVPSFFEGILVSIDFVVFPDAGASKRFGPALTERGAWKKELVADCTKVRNGAERNITVNSGQDFTGLTVLIIDDLVRTGGTLVKCAEALKARGAKNVFAFCTHVAGSIEQLRKLSHSALDRFFTTNTVECTAKDLANDAFFRIVDVAPWIRNDIIRCSRTRAEWCDDEADGEGGGERSKPRTTEKKSQKKPEEKPEENTVLRVLLCSTSTHKTKALQVALERVFPKRHIQLATGSHFAKRRVEIEVMATQSGVPSQPMTLEETVSGCENRLCQGQDSICVISPDYIVSVESGLCEHTGHDIACVKVANRDRDVTTSYSSSMQFPRAAIEAWEASLHETKVIADFVEECEDRADPHTFLCGVSRTELIAQAMTVAFGIHLKSEAVSKTT